MIDSDSINTIAKEFTGANGARTANTVFDMVSSWGYNNNTPNALTFDTFSDTTTIQISTTTWTALQPTRFMADTPVVPDATRTRLY